ncbi:hypothetical protein GFY24_31300 [Nocardia sp. SYP-A9097]|uniref:hypothetical protein n=1 Tax=Nocardia sp. SYP-A9097 TaxID=2663237 RepID=UPI00129B35A6|nr:hypothetical protein [Nocardia sp. SYP-A9097]MRH91872.1 hypothetical protein [Nocardia sp. SYP-A9097]
MDRDFLELIAKAAAVSVAGRDFSWPAGRVGEQRRLATTRAALDIRTAGGEVLAEAEYPPRTMVATESGCHRSPGVRSGDQQASGHLVQ